MTGSLPANPLPKGHPAAKLMNASYAAWHLCMSLLACREGATDDLIIEVRDALADAIIHTALMGIEEASVQSREDPGKSAERS